MVPLMVLSSVGYSSEGSPFWLPLVGAIGGFLLFFLSVYFYYRNTNKHYRYEQETATTVSDLQATDSFLRPLRGTQRRQIPGNNVSSYRTPLQPLRRE
jgi:hypothetical protein